MAKEWSKSWVSSIQPRKQRKFRANAPLHVRRKFVNAALSKDLKKEHGFRSIAIRRGDTVRMLTGQFKGSSGKVSKVSVKRGFIHVEGAVLKKADGTDSFYPVNASNVEIIKFDTSDKRRTDKIERLKKENGKQ